MFSCHLLFRSCSSSSSSCSSTVLTSSAFSFTVRRKLLPSVTYITACLVSFFASNVSAVQMRQVSWWYLAAASLSSFSVIQSGQTQPSSFCLIVLFQLFSLILQGTSCISVWNYLQPGVTLYRLHQPSQCHPPSHMPHTSLKEVKCVLISAGADGGRRSVLTWVMRY